MIKLLILLLGTLSLSTLAKCVHERKMLGEEILQEQKKSKVFVEVGYARFVPSQSLLLKRDKVYTAQVFELDKPKTSKQRINNPHDEYNKKYLEYYTYARMKKYIEDNRAMIGESGYQVRVVGKSLLGRDLFAITPKVLEDKKTILMFGRHHGDEGTANWIIEGFLNEYLTNKEFRENYQLILYPMVNPDGAEAHSRYNSNGRDLNRSWDKSLASSYDEVKIIHTDLKVFMNKIQKRIFIALDMHGSFYEDFIYRVKRNYVSRDFFNRQQNFIDELSRYDFWQNGNDKKSNGDPAMARLVLINHYKKNAMTHESIRNIPKNNNQGRTLQSLKEQGVSLVKTIQNLY